MAAVMLLELFPELKNDGIDFVDIGCSGALDTKWRDLFEVLNYVGFDPDAAECRRLEAQPSPFRSSRYLPTAVASFDDSATLHLTTSPACCSLLEPRREWLDRFAFRDLFEDQGQTRVNCTTLDTLSTREGLRADVMKIDSQGLELPILQNAQRILAEVFCVETETGFIENYRGETTSAQIDPFMRRHGFLLFDTKLNRVGRANAFAGVGRHQVMWCESLWLRDFLADRSWGLAVPAPDRTRAVRALAVCGALGFLDYGLELAEHFASLGLLDAGEQRALRDLRTWTAERPARGGALDLCLRLLPGRWRSRLFEAVKRTAGKPHLLRRVFPRRDPETT